MEICYNGCLLSCTPNTRLSKDFFVLFNSPFDIGTHSRVCGSFQTLSIQLLTFSLTLGLSKSVHIKTHLKYSSPAEPLFAGSLIPWFRFNNFYCIQCLCVSQISPNFMLPPLLILLCYATLFYDLHEYFSTFFNLIPFLLK